MSMVRLTIYATLIGNTGNNGPEKLTSRKDKSVSSEADVLYVLLTAKGCGIIARC